MFDIGASELLVIAIIAIIAIGPKELPLALRTAGRWIAKVRRVSGQFRTGFDAMVREAEAEDMERKWKEQNEAIMANYPSGDMPASDPETEMLPLQGGEAPDDGSAPDAPGEAGAESPGNDQAKGAS